MKNHDFHSKMFIYTTVAFLLFCLTFGLAFLFGYRADISTLSPHSVGSAWSNYEYIASHNLGCFIWQWSGALMIGVPTLGECLLGAAVAGKALKMTGWTIFSRYVLIHALPENTALLWNAGATLTYMHFWIKSLWGHSIPVRQVHRLFAIHAACATFLLLAAAALETMVIKQN